MGVWDETLQGDKDPPSKVNAYVVDGYLHPLGWGGLRVLLEVIAVKWCKSGLIRSQASPNCPVGGPNAGGAWLSGLKLCREMGIYPGPMLKQGTLTTRV